MILNCHGIVLIVRFLAAWLPCWALAAPLRKSWTFILRVNPRLLSGAAGIYLCSIKVNTVFLKDGLVERIVSEGERSLAELLIVVVGRGQSAVAGQHRSIDRGGGHLSC